MQQALVTVVIPCFNMGEALWESIRSVQRQTYDNIEILVVDDGSTDLETQSLLSQVEASGISVIRKPNGGVSSALNTGLSSARGTYFTVLGDDLIEPPYMAEAVAALEADPELGIVYCRADFFGAVTGPWLLPDFSVKTELMQNCIFTTAFFRLRDWREVGGFDESMRGREDHDFILKIVGLGRAVRRLDGLYFHYRRPLNGGSVNAAVGGDRALLVASHAAILRNNQRLYLDNAEAFFEWIFELADARNDLANRYQALERMRTSVLGARIVNLAKGIRKRFFRR